MGLSSLPVSLSTALPLRPRSLSGLPASPNAAPSQPRLCAGCRTAPPSTACAAPWPREPRVGSSAWGAARGEQRLSKSRACPRAARGEPRVGSRSPRRAAQVRSAPAVLRQAVCAPSPPGPPSSFSLWLLSLSPLSPSPFPFSFLLFCLF